MTDPTAPELDPREELASLAASTRALLEQYEASGADLVPGAGALPAPAPPPREAARPAPEPRPASEARPVPAPPPREAARPAPEPRPVPAPPPRAPVLPAPLSEAAQVQASAAPPGERLRITPEAVRVVQPGSEADDRRMRLALLAEEVRPCTKCILCETRTQTVFARGNPFAELCFVGEGPGASEDAQGEPFVGAAGQLLDRMIAAMGYRRDDVYICNVVKCRPPGNRKPEINEMEACSPYLREQLALVKPKVMVALGGTAMTGLTGTTEGITRLRGKWKLYNRTIPVMPTFHPAYLLRNPAAKREVWSDLQEVMKHLGKPLPRPGAGRGDE